MQRNETENPYSGPVGRIEAEMDRMSKGHKAIARFILSDYERAAYMTAAKIGDQTGVSESTVVRFTMELGYDGYPHFQKMYDEYAAVLETIDAAGKEEKKSLSIAFAYGLSNCINTDFIFDYQKEHTEINMKIEEWSQSICIQKLLKGELQLAFLVTPIDQKLFRSFSLAEDYMFAAIHKNHPLAAEDTPFDFSRLDGEKIITGAPENALREMFDYFCEVTNISPRIIVSSSYSLNFVNAMTENAGIATVTSAMARRITNPDIVIRRLLTPEPGLMYCCTPHQTKCGKELTGLLRYVKRYFENMPEKRFKET